MKKSPINICGNAFVTEKTYRITKDYDIIGKIGHGAFSQTFKARHKITKQIRCIKKLKKKDFKKEEQEKLIEEVLILKDLDHPNIGNLFFHRLQLAISKQPFHPNQEFRLIRERLKF